MEVNPGRNTEHNSKDTGNAADSIHIRQVRTEVRHHIRHLSIVFVRNTPGFVDNVRNVRHVGSVGRVLCRGILQLCHRFGRGADQSQKENMGYPHYQLFLHIW
uniref:Uncharacterized protein n=1 Tax=Cacopsylla melanoneura TaxID=428564 RepID=A0A8D8YW46_9HEMI